MKRPSFQFYPADWQANSNLRRCSHEERGIWIDVLCLLHDQEEYGVIRWTLKEIAQAIGCTPSKLSGLVLKGVLKGADKGAHSEALVYVPRHSRKDGEPVTLIPSQQGPIWYSSRMVVDEYKRVVRGESTPTPKAAPNPPIGAAPEGTPNSTPLRAGVSSSSSPTEHTDTNVSVVRASAPPACPHLEIIALYNRILPELQHVIPERWDGARADALRSRWRESPKHQRLEFWERFFNELRNHRFYMGENDRAWKADLGWIVKRSNFDKLIEKFTSRREAV
ncbi:MAG: hypothetical protein Q8L60_10795 [Gammaproteobacteria bacterium]|nr:hypothetical protein [Gammaproteobacteria bacterium]